MWTQLLFPTCPGVRVDRIWREMLAVHIVVTATRRWARCPVCGRRSRRVHSRYQRTVADLPWCGTPVTIHLHTRRFQCRVRWCPRTIFTERLELLAASARRTTRARDQVLRTAFALGGNPGQRFACAAGTPVSARTLLRLIRRTPAAASEPVTALGVDDWAYRRGATYGTLLVNLSTHRVIDLLPDRQATTFACWLRAHPEIRVITRDRGGAYAEGARQGAPQALQVADRFHLRCNVTQALQRYLGRKQAALRQARVLDGPDGDVDLLTVATTPPDAVAPARLGRAARRSQERRARRIARYEEVVALRAQGHTLRAIAQITDLHMRTVMRFVHAEGFPERQQRTPRHSALAPFTPYLRARWAAGCHNAMHLWLELREQGFSGCSTSVATFVRAWRCRPSAPSSRRRDGAYPAPATPHYGPRQACWLLLRPLDSLTTAEQAFLTRLYHACPQIAIAEALVEEFTAVFRTRDVDGLSAWIRGVELSAIPELCGVARRMWRDRAAVEAAVATDYSNGQLEGQVNRLKVIKRVGYGRAKFDLLRQRVLYDSATCRHPDHQKRL